jgi:lipopolysaccharide O-acetyltransferase
LAFCLLAVAQNGNKSNGINSNDLGTTIFLFDYRLCPAPKDVKKLTKSHESQKSMNAITRCLRNNGLLSSFGIVVEISCNYARSFFLGYKLRTVGLWVRSGCNIHGLSCMNIGRNLNVGRGLWLEAVIRYHGENFSPRIEIGDNVSISFWCHIAAAKSIKIGSGTMIGSKVTIIDHNHGCYGPSINDSPQVLPADRPLSMASIQIGSNVWIADGVVVTAGSEIGDGSVIGANSVVRGKIPPFTLAVGVPARPVKRFDFELQKWI